MSSYLTTAIAASTYASKTATADQSFAGNIVIGTGKTVSTPAITLNGTDLSQTLATLAPKDSPQFTTTATAPTPATADNSTKIATTAHVKSNLSSYAVLNGPTFTGTVNAANITATGTLKVGTTDIGATLTSVVNNLNGDVYGFWYYPWIAGLIHANSTNVQFTSTYSNNAGAVVAPVRNSTGNYTIKWTTAYSGTPLVQATPYTNSGTIRPAVWVVSWTSTSLTFQLKDNNSGTAYDGDFFFMMMT